MQSREKKFSKGLHTYQNFNISNACPGDEWSNEKAKEFRTHNNFN